MDKKIKLLHLAPRVPYPADDGGKIAIYNTLKFLARQNITSTFVFFSEDSIDTNILLELKKYADVIVFNHSTKNTLFRIIKSVFKLESIYIKKHSTNQFIKFLSELNSERKFDFALADHTCMGYPLSILKELTNLPFAIKLNNIEWIIWKRYANKLSYLNPKKYYIILQYYLLRKEEANLIANSDASFAITDFDYQRAIDLAPNANIKKIPLGVNLEEWIFDDNIIKNTEELIIATTYNWIHNVDALQWFIKNVMPSLISVYPNIKLTLLGKDMPDWMKNLDKTNYNPIGYVDKVQPYLNKATIYIAPLFVGSGVRIKILEALSLGLPVVATDIAAEGIEANESNGLYRANNAIDFANKIIFLLKNQNNLQKQSKKAIQFIREKHSWDIHIRIMLDEIYSRISK